MKRTYLLVGLKVAQWGYLKMSGRIQGMFDKISDEGSSDLLAVRDRREGDGDTECGDNLFPFSLGDKWQSGFNDP